MLNMGQKSDVAMNKTKEDSIAGNKVQYQGISGSNEKVTIQYVIQKQITHRYEYKEFKEEEINMNRN